VFSFVVVFDRLPDMRLSVNGRNKIHFMERSKLTEEARNEAYYLAKDALSKCDYWVAPEKARISYEFYSDDKKVKDIEGGLIPACKPWVDSLVKAGVILGDSGWILWIGRAELRLAHQKQTRLIIESLEV
jgi:hypothetical protein